VLGDCGRVGRADVRWHACWEALNSVRHEPPGATILDAERLDCYVVALELQVAAAALASAVIRSFATSCGAPAFPSS